MRSALLLLPALVLVAFSTPASAEDPGDPPPARPAPRGWTLEAGVLTQRIHDDGAAVLGGSRIPAAELRLRRDLLDAGRLRIGPEASYALARPTRDLGGATSELWLSRLSAGVRVSAASARPAFRGYARGGAMALHGTALFHDPHRDHRDEGFGAGLYGAAGVELDAGLLTPRSRLVFAAEGGYAGSTGLDFPRLGTLAVEGVFWSASAAVRF